MCVSSVLLPWTQVLCPPDTHLVWDSDLHLHPVRGSTDFFITFSGGEHPPPQTIKKAGSGRNETSGAENTCDFSHQRAGEQSWVLLPHKSFFVLLLSPNSFHTYWLINWAYLFKTSHLDSYNSMPVRVLKVGNDLVSEVLITLNIKSNKMSKWWSEEGSEVWN